MLYFPSEFFPAWKPRLFNLKSSKGRNRLRYLKLLSSSSYHCCSLPANVPTRKALHCLEKRDLKFHPVCQFAPKVSCRLQEFFPKPSIHERKSADDLKYTSATALGLAFGWLFSAWASRSLTNDRAPISSISALKGYTSSHFSAGGRSFASSSGLRNMISPT